MKLTFSKSVIKVISEFLMELKVSEDRILIWSRIILSNLGREMLMELTVSDGSILTS